MNTDGCLALILAGGRGKRLGSLTHYSPKPAVHFGRNRRIIDFTINNCRDSGIDTIGILSQCFADDLHTYIGTSYKCAPEHNGIYMLPPQNNDNLYRGTADAVYKNMEFIERFRPECVLILAGDHIYKMNYGKMIAFHKESNAEITIASTPVPQKEASRFGVIGADRDGRIHGFEEKPRFPKSNLASMGIYVFKWNTLKKYLLANNLDKLTHHDFGKDIIPSMLYAGESMFTYEFDGYWRDVGTVDSLWEANMDQIDHPDIFRFKGEDAEQSGPYAYNIISHRAVIYKSIISSGCSIFGNVVHSVLGDEVKIGLGAEIVNSVVMPGAYIGDNVKIYNAVIGTKAVIMDNTVIGSDDGIDYFIDSGICAKGVSLVSPWLTIDNNMKFKKGSHICKEWLIEWKNSSVRKPKVTSQQFMQ